MHTYAPQRVYGGQRTTCQESALPLVWVLMWVPGVELRSWDI